MVAQQQEKIATNNRGFEIERNYQDGNWILRSFIPGIGTTTEKKDYCYIDEPELSGKYSYRLKQFDYDGKYKYFDPVTVDFNYTPCYSLEQNYPNPFNPVTKISYSIPVYSNVSLKIFAALGRE